MDLLFIAARANALPLHSEPAIPEDGKYRESAVRLQQIVLRYRGSEAAADIVEEVIFTAKQ